MFLKKSSFRILDIQIRWRHQMPRHKTRNRFYWITLEVNTVYKWNFASLCHITKEKISSKNSAKTTTGKLVPCPLFLQRIRNKLHWKMIFLKQAIYIRYLTAILSKCVQIILQIPFYRGLFEKSKGSGTSFQATFFI